MLLFGATKKKIVASNGDCGRTRQCDIVKSTQKALACVCGRVAIDFAKDKDPEKPSKRQRLIPRAQYSLGTSQISSDSEEKTPMALGLHALLTLVAVDTA